MNLGQGLGRKREIGNREREKLTGLTGMGAGNCSFEEDTGAAAGGSRAHRSKEGSRT